MYIADTSLQLNIKTQDAAKPRFSFNKGIEMEYDKILSSVAERVSKIVNEYDPQNPKTSVKVIKALEDYANKLFDWSTKWVGNIIYKLNSDTEKQWQQHSMRISQGLHKAVENVPIEPLMRKYLEDNVGLIQSMPLKAAQRVQQLVLENLKTGELRAEDLADKIVSIGKVTENRAKTIARTEIAKITTGLTEARCDYLGIGWYVWKSTHDARVRSAHSLMNNVLINWNDPASPEELAGKKSYGHYHPGEIFNCRCYARPLIRINDVQWPAKVYINGGIQMMKKIDFAKISEGQIPMAA